MRRAGLLLVVLMAISGPSCQAKGKAQVPKFIQADNGLAAAASLRAGDFLTKVALHFAGLDPPVIWEPFPKTADLIPAWMDEPVVMPPAVHAIGAPRCGAGDYGALASALREAPPPVAPAQPKGLIRLDGPSISGLRPGDLDSRGIYGHFSDACLQSAKD